MSDFKCSVCKEIVKQTQIAGLTMTASAICLDCAKDEQLYLWCRGCGKLFKKQDLASSKVDDETFYYCEKCEGEENGF